MVTSAGALALLCPNPATFCSPRPCKRDAPELCSAVRGVWITTYTRSAQNSRLNLNSNKHVSNAQACTIIVVVPLLLLIAERRCQAHAAALQGDAGAAQGGLIKAILAEDPVSAGRQSHREAVAGS